MTENLEILVTNELDITTAIQAKTMKEAVGNTKVIIKSIQADFETSLLKAIEISDTARLHAEVELNAMSRNLDQIAEEKRKRSSGYSETFISILWAFVIVSILLVAANSYNVWSTASDFLENYTIEAYAFSVKIAFFTAAALYPVGTFFSYRSRGNAKRKITLADKGCQTDGSSGVDVIAPHTNRDANEDVKSIKSEGKVISLSNKSSEGNEGEVAHLQAYVTPMKKVGNEWKTYGSLKMSISTVDGSHSMVFRNDIGVLHMNLPIVQKMDFERIEDKYIRFASIEDEVTGLEIFMLKVSPKILDKVHSKLVELAE